MALPLIPVIGAIGLAALIGVTAVIIEPLSLGAAALTVPFLYRFLRNFDFGLPYQQAVKLGISIIIGYVIYRILGWLLVGAGLLITLAIVAVLLIGGTSLLYILMLEVLDN